MKQKIKGITFNRIDGPRNYYTVPSITIELSKEIPPMGYSSKKLIKLIKEDIKRYKP